MNLQELLGDAFKDGMTIEEINEALAGKEMPKDSSAEIAKLKDSISRANSEAKKLKDELNAKLSEDERKAKEDAEAREEMAKELESLRREKSISTFKAQFLENGYDSDLASESAEALVGGDYKKVFDNLGKHLANLEKKFKAEKIDNMPKPNGGSGTTPNITKEQFDKMTYKERADLYSTNLELYKELSKGD